MKWLERASLLVKRGTVLGDVFERLARLHGDAPLVAEADGDALTYAEAALRVGRFAAGIHATIKPGDRVVIATPNGYDMFLLCIAAARAGGLAVPVNAAMTASEVDHVIADSGASLVVRDVQEVLAPAPLDDLARPDPSAVAAVFYTSGTTGRPKGVRLSHKALIGQLQLAAIWPSGLRRDEAVVGLPVAHIMGFAVLLGLAWTGVPVYFLPRFRPDIALDGIEQRRATMFVGVPAMYRLMLEAGAEERDLRSVRVWASGADVMPAELARRFQKMGASMTLPVVGRSLGEAAFVEGYGMVELGGGVAVKVAPPVLPLPGRDLLGLPLPPWRFRVIGDSGTQVRVGEVGELQVTGPGVLEGYHGDAEGTRAVITDDGWVRTGDLVRRGPFGMVTFVGRAKDVIKQGGYSVYAVEVQGVLEEHPAVAEAAVVGVRDDRVGEQVAAAVRLAPGQAADADELRSWAADRMADYKVPARITIVHELPRTGTAKVRRDAVRDLFPVADRGNV